jgi:hypothetical protein
MSSLLLMKEACRRGFLGRKIDAFTVQEREWWFPWGQEFNEYRRV